MGILTELRVAWPVPLVFDRPALRTSRSSALGLVRRVVMNRWMW